MTTLVCSAGETHQIEIFPSSIFNVTGGDDVRQLKKLALSTGWEFSPNSITDAYLKDLGINRIRCINIDRFPGTFDATGNFHVYADKTTRLDRHLNTCKTLGAIPHLVIGPSMPDALLSRAKPKQVAEGIMGNVGVSGRVYGPTDYSLYRNYYEAIFNYIIIEKGVDDAVFEAFNEPDIGGGFIYETPEVPGRGSKEAYDNLFKNYCAIAEAADAFEKRHPDKKVVLGGPALAWAFTFKFGAFNWGEHFVADCATNNVKLDFIGVHYYGNISPIEGETKPEYNAYPSFRKMVDKLKETLAKYNPGLPIYVTEYGPSYDVTYRPKAMVNGDNIGAGWNMSFLKAMLDTGIDTAAYLVTTDNARRDKNNGQLNNIWGWVSYFVNPDAYGYPYPKAPYHVYKMISDLKGRRVETRRTGVNTDVIATVDAERKTLQILLWNYAADIPEFDNAIDRSETEVVTLTIDGAGEIFSSDPRMISKVVDAENGNIMRLRETNEPLTLKAASPAITEHGIVKLAGDKLKIQFPMTKSSVVLIELGPDPKFSTPAIPYSEAAAQLLQAGRQEIRNGESGLAMRAFEKVLDIADAASYQKSDALFNLLESAKARKNNKDILKWAGKLIALEEALPAHLSHALISVANQYRLQGRFTDSDERSRRLLGFSTDRYDRMRAELCLGYNLMDQERYEDAVKMFEEVHHQDYYGGSNYRVPAYLATAQCYLVQEDYFGAIAAYTSILEDKNLQGSESGEYQFFAIIGIARCYFAMGQHDKARETLEQAGVFNLEIPFPE